MLQWLLQLMHSFALTTNQHPISITCFLKFYAKFVLFHWLASRYQTKHVHCWADLNGDCLCEYLICIIIKELFFNIINIIINESFRFHKAENNITFNTKTYNFFENNLVLVYLHYKFLFHLWCIIQSLTDVRTTAGLRHAGIRAFKLSAPARCCLLFVFSPVQWYKLLWMIAWDSCLYANNLIN